MHPSIQQHQAAIAELCRRYHVRRLDVFGSAARGDDFDSACSDADFLVEFAAAPEPPPSLQTFFDLRQELAQLIGRDVDLAETAVLRNPYLRASIDSSRELVYAA
jgi:predicted nucleotidyltransferase